MKPLFVLIGIIAANLLCAQNHYVVEYDRINDEVNYYQVHNIHGKHKEELIGKNIAVTEGDILQARLINVNELVFKSSLAIDEVEKTSSPINGIIALVENVASGSSAIFGAIAKILDISEAMVNEVQRGAEDERSIEFKLNSQISLIQKDIKPAKTYFEILTSTLPQVQYAKDKTKEEITKEVSSLESQIKSIEIESIYKKVDAEISELKNLIEQAEFADKNVMESANEIIELWGNYNSNDYAEGKEKVIFEQTRSRLDSVDFIDTEYHIVGELDHYNDDIVIDFEMSVIDQKYYPTIYNHRMVRIKRKKPTLTIVNGMVVNFPMTNKMSFDLLQAGDSVSFVSRQNRMDYNLSTMVQYEFAGQGPVSPSVNFGISIPLRDSSGFSLNQGMRILTGAGLRIKRFPNLAFTTAIAWGISDVLNSNLSYDTFYDEQNLIDEGILLTNIWSGAIEGVDPEYIQSKWSTGISVGISILLD